jgi:hypothetical protein
MPLLQSSSVPGPKPSCNHPVQAGDDPLDQAAAAFLVRSCLLASHRRASLSSGPRPHWWPLLHILLCVAVIASNLCNLCGDRGADRASPADTCMFTISGIVIAILVSNVIPAALAILRLRGQGARICIGYGCRRSRRPRSLSPSRAFVASAHGTAAARTSRRALQPARGARGSAASLTYRQWPLPVGTGLSAEEARLRLEQGRSGVSVGSGGAVHAAARSVHGLSLSAPCCPHIDMKKSKRVGGASVAPRHGCVSHARRRSLNEGGYWGEQQLGEAAGKGTKHSCAVLGDSLPAQFHGATFGVGMSVSNGLASSNDDVALAPHRPPAVTSEALDPERRRPPIRNAPVHTATLDDLMRCSICQNTAALSQSILAGEAVEQCEGSGSCRGCGRVSARGGHRRGPAAAASPLSATATGREKGLDCKSVGRGEEVSVGKAVAAEHSTMNALRQRCASSHPSFVKNQCVQGRCVHVPWHVAL